MAYDVIGIGNALVDILGHIEDGFLQSQGLERGSMTLVNEARSGEIYAHLGQTVAQSGGSAANTIAGLGMLGARAACIGRVRNDQFGEVFRHDLQASGVDFRGVVTEDGPATGRCLVMVSPDAQRTMATYLGAGVDLAPENIDEAAVADSQIVYLEGYLFDKPGAKQAFQRAADIAHEAGGKAALTLSDSFCVERHRADFQALVEGGVDILFANEAEICALYQLDDFAQAARLVADKVEIAALTRSEKGALIIAGDEECAIDAKPIEKLIDTTGAGDLFASGFLYGLSQNAPLARCGAMGCAAAGAVIQQMGPRPEADLRALFRASGLL